MLFPTLKKKKKKNWCKKKFGGGGGGVEFFFFFIKTILSHFTFYAIFNIKKILIIILKSAPSLLYPLFLCSDFVSQMWGGLGGGV